MIFFDHIKGSRTGAKPFLRVYLAPFIATLLCLFTISFGQTKIGQFSFGAAGYADAGRFFVKDTSNNGEFLNRAGAKWNISGEISEELVANVNLHWFWWRNKATDLAAFHIAGMKFDSDLTGTLSYRPAENYLAKLGIYEFKYNPDAKNLGEYLLRSEAYPQVIETSQEKDLLSPAHARVAGAEFQLHLGPLQNRALLYLEQTNFPVNDMSGALFSGVSGGAGSVEAGWAYRRFLKLGASKTKHPTTDRQDSVRQAYIESFDLSTTAHTLMLRGSLNIFGLLGNPEDQSFKLYTEIALLGLKKDSIFYKDISSRLPIMVGVNIPSANFFQTLNIEVEYLKQPFLDKKYSRENGDGSGKFSELPPSIDLPILPTDPAVVSPGYTQDDLRWSFLATKALNPWVNLSVRMASDHLRLLGWEKDVENQGKPMTESKSDFYIMVRLEWHN